MVDKVAVYYDLHIKEGSTGFDLCTDETTVEFNLSAGELARAIRRYMHKLAIRESEHKWQENKFRLALEVLDMEATSVLKKLGLDVFEDK